MELAAEAVIVQHSITHAAAFALTKMATALAIQRQVNPAAADHGGSAALHQLGHSHVVQIAEFELRITEIGKFRTVIGIAIRLQP